MSEILFALDSQCQSNGTEELCQKARVFPTKVRGSTENYILSTVRTANACSVLSAFIPGAVWRCFTALCWAPERLLLVILLPLEGETDAVSPICLSEVSRHTRERIWSPWCVCVITLTQYSFPQSKVNFQRELLPISVIGGVTITRIAILVLPCWGNLGLEFYFVMFHYKYSPCPNRVRLAVFAQKHLRTNLAWGIESCLPPALFSRSSGRATWTRMERRCPYSSWPSC